LQAGRGGAERVSRKRLVVLQRVSRKRLVVLQAGERRQQRMTASASGPGQEWPGQEWPGQEWPGQDMRRMVWAHKLDSMAPHHAKRNASPRSEAPAPARGPVRKKAPARGQVRREAAARGAVRRRRRREAQ
jgi:hypothetical protein